MASSEPTHVGELPGGVAAERGGAAGRQVAPVGVAQGGRIRRLASPASAAAAGGGPDERAEARRTRDPSRWRPRRCACGSAASPAREGTTSYWWYCLQGVRRLVQRRRQRLRRRRRGLRPPLASGLSRRARRWTVGRILRAHATAADDVVVARACRPCRRRRRSRRGRTCGARPSCRAARAHRRHPPRGQGRPAACGRRGGWGGGGGGGRRRPEEEDDA